MVRKMSSIGTIVDNKYELVQYINKGGMSAVYLAVNKRLGNRWAIKEIKKTNEQFNQIYINSLIAEASLMKDLDHPAFPRIVDIIDTEEYLYLVMDYIEGQTLEQVLNEYGPQDEKTVARWAIELCGALSYLHNQNPPIIYRDMKPSNIIINPNGRLKIIDFGTARVFNPQKANDTIALGTRGFAPPEQYAGRTDARSDIYALGMTMKYLVTGKNPCLEYSSNTYETKQISESMQAIIDKCIEINLENRYQSCEELANDLIQACSNSSSKKPNTLIKIIVPIVVVIIALGITISALAINNTNNTNNKQNENMTATINSTIESTNHIYTVPDTVGMEYEKALSLLRESGFTVESEEEYNDNIEYGHVIRQSVQAGEQFEKPQVIELIVSKGKEKKDTDNSEVSSNSKDSSENVNENGEYIDYNSDNNHVDNDVSESENTGNNKNASNSNSSNNDNDYSVVDPPDQSSNEDKHDYVDKGIDEIPREEYEMPFIQN